MASPSLLKSSRHRKATGAYYTPAPLIDLLLDHALPLPHSGPLRILDPACGPGDFLRAAHERLRNNAHQLFGVDVDPAAVARCRSGLPDASIQTADALLDPPAFLKPQSFDLVLGNPPFVNGIEGNLAPAMKKRLRAIYTNVRGAADLAHYFLDQATRLVLPEGRIAFVLPRALLNSPAARPLRAGLPSHLRPNLIYAPERHDLFPGAAIFICLLILGPGPLCQFSTDPEPASARFNTAPVTGDNWWLALQAGKSPLTARPVESLWVERHDAPPALTLSSRFEVCASMIAADAYDLLPHLVDDLDAAGPKLVTTGLIEPRACLWGRRNCRYLKKDYRHPRLAVSLSLTRSLASRAAKARRPKILVAGLARKIEAFLDPIGEYLGAVSTFSIFHPDDDLPALSQLLQALLSPAATQSLIDHLGANGMRGRHITLKKSFLQNLPLIAR